MSHPSHRIVPYICERGLSFPPTKGSYDEPQSTALRRIKDEVRKGVERRKEGKGTRGV
jgi:hypothetical protein